MSYEFKLRRPRRGKLYKKVRRAVINNSDANHLPMRMPEYYNSGERGRFPLKELRGFLMARVGKPVDKVFSEFLMKVKRFSHNQPAKDLFNSIINNNSSIVSPGFYVSNGILNYRKCPEKKKAYSQKHIQYNKTHINENILKLLQPKECLYLLNLYPTGPIYLGKLWVVVKGMPTLLPVWGVIRYKYEAKLSNEHYIRGVWSKSSIEHLKLFTKVTVIGAGEAYRVLHYKNSVLDCDYYDYVVKIRDIENYIKQKIKI